MLSEIIIAFCTIVKGKLVFRCSVCLTKFGEARISTIQQFNYALVLRLE